MIDTYVPLRFCRDFVEVKGNSSQLVNFMALTIGMKPFMDDWIPRERLPAFEAMCEREGIHLAADCVFAWRGKQEMDASVIGRETLTTSQVYALPMESAVRNYVHVFLSRDREHLRHGMWYTAVVRQRVVWPPRMDLLRYGQVLGYPPCCVEFFRRYNDWTRNSFLQLIHERSRGFHPACNPLAKDRTFSYIYHMPCAFDCAATIAYTTRLRSEIAIREPDLVPLIDAQLRQPALVFRERKIYFFDGALDASRREIRYRGFSFEGSDPAEDRYSEDLARGNRVTVDGQMVRIWNQQSAIREIVCDAVAFAPEKPFLVAFAAPFA